MALKDYLLVTRPWSFTMSLISVSVGTLVAAEDGELLWGWYLLTLLGMVCFHAAANVLNDYFDTGYGIDRPDSPTVHYRPQAIVSGLLTPRQVMMEAVVFLAATILIGLIIAYARTWHVLWIGLAGVLVGVFYTAGPVKLKYRALGELAVFLIWGPLMVEGAYAVQRQALSLKALYLSVPFGILVALVLFANNMRDISYDARQNIKTLGILLGRKGSFVLFAGFIVAAYLYVLGMVALGVMGPWGLLIFLSLPKAWSLLQSFRREIPDAADALTAQFDTVFGILLMAALFLDRIRLL